MVAASRLRFACWKSDSRRPELGCYTSGVAGGRLYPYPCLWYSGSWVTPSITLEDYVERLRLYRELSSLWGVTVVNARSSPETIHGELWDGISAKVPDRKRVG